MSKLSKIVSVILIIMMIVFITVTVQAAQTTGAQQKVIDYLLGTHQFREKTVQLKATADREALKEYLTTVNISDADAETVIQKFDAAIKLLDESGANDKSGLTIRQYNEITGNVADACDLIKLDLYINDEAQTVQFVKQSDGSILIPFTKVQSLVEVVNPQPSNPDKDTNTSTNTNTNTTTNTNVNNNTNTTTNTTNNNVNNNTNTTTNTTNNNVNNNTNTTTNTTNNNTNTTTNTTNNNTNTTTTNNNNSNSNSNAAASTSKSNSSAKLVYTGRNYLVAIKIMLAIVAVAIVGIIVKKYAK